MENEVNAINLASGIHVPFGNRDNELDAFGSRVTRQDSLLRVTFARDSDSNKNTTAQGTVRLASDYQLHVEWPWDSQFN